MREGRERSLTATRSRFEPRELKATEGDAHTRFRVSILFVAGYPIVFEPRSARGRSRRA